MTWQYQGDHSKQAATLRLPAWLRLGVATSAALALVLGLAWRWSATAAVPQAAHAPQSAPQAALAPSAYLYRLDPASGIFFTITLSEGSQPSDVRVVADGPRQHLWFSEPGLGRIGHVVFTSSADYAFTETSIGDNPVSLAASNTDVWFTLPAQNQIGRLDIRSGTVTRYNLPSAQADPADIELDSSGQAWLTERMANRLASVTITPTVVITEYPLSSTVQGPEGVSPSQDGSIWLAASATNYVLQLDPQTGQYSTSLWLGSDSSPYHLTHDRYTSVWTTLRNANQLVQLMPGSSSPVFYPIPTPNSKPTAIGVDSSNRIYFAEQSAGQIGQLVITPTVTFIEYPLPQSSLKLTGLAVASDDAVWATAYMDVYTTYLPLLMLNYNPVIPPSAVQMYGSINTLSGLTQMVETGAKWVRTQVLWSQIESIKTTPRSYDWTNLDASVQAATNSDIHLMLTLEGNPSWAAKTARGPVYNLVDLQEFVGTAVARYPQVEFWELYNEPDDEYYYGSNAADYAAMLKAIYPTIKAANPNAKVVMGGLAMDWFTEDGGVFVKSFLDNVLANCSGPCFDLANFHYYSVFRSTWEPYGRDIIGKANYVRQVMARHGYNRPLINTETGWPAASIWGSPELQARYAVKGNIRGLAAGLGMINWYSLLDMDTSQPGLLASDLTPRPAYYAFRTMMSLIGSARYVRAIPASETGSVYVEGYQFFVLAGDRSKRLDVYWYDCPSMYSYGAGGWPTDCSNTAPLQINATRIAVIDKMGVTRILNDASDGLVNGKITIPGGISSSPIYVDYAP